MSLNSNSSDCLAALSENPFAYLYHNENAELPSSDYGTSTFDFNTKEKINFMKKVYQLHVHSASTKRKYTPGLSRDQLGSIEDGIEARKDVALACKSLLNDARKDLNADKNKRIETALDTSYIGVASGYRSPSYQLKNWINYFKRKYYPNTQRHRSTLNGGEHGDAAARYLRNYIGSKLAAPGFSLHNTGLAVDMKTRFKKIALGPDTSQAKLWRQSWFYHWMIANAPKFNFFENLRINEPWHWEFI